MRKNTQILLLIISFFCLNIIKSQTTASSFQAPKISPSNPDVSTLFKYTDIPVSNTTGIPNISINIHEIKLKEYSLPININYHSSGIIIDEIASKVGLGWSLNAGGMIYQNVIGKPDRINNRYPVPQDRELDPEINTGNTICSPITNEDYHLVNNLAMASNDDVDSEPDVYYYSVGEKNGKFFFDNNNVAHTMPKSDIKIIRDVKGIIIYDEMGIKYTFHTPSLTRSQWSISQSSVIVPSSSQSGGTDSYSYYLTEIETPQKEKLFFTYNDYTYEYINPQTKIWKKRPFSGEGVGCESDGIDYYPLEIKQTIDNLAFIQGKSISKIVTANQRIDFIYENCPRLDLPPTSGLSNPSPSTTGDFALKGIKISDSNLIKINEFKFNYSYFNLNNYEPCISKTDATLANSYRLKLESVVKNNIETHSFQYYSPTSPYYSNTLPGRLSTNYDNWNRFNYQTSGDFTFDSAFNNGGTNRDPDLESTLSGVLKQIKYPTGGVTRFEYGLNKIYGGEKLPPIEKSVSLHINGTQEIGIPNVPQYLSKTFTINNLIDGIVKYYCHVNTGEQTSTDWVNISLYDHQTNSFFDLPGCSNQSKNIYSLTNGTYTLHVDGITEGGGAGFTWYELNNGEPIYDNSNIGGLRIQEITSFDKEEDLIPSLKKKYSYSLNNDLNKSSGKILNYPRNTFIENKVRLCCIDETSLARFNLNYRVLQNKIVEPLSNLNGYHIMYTDVQVYNENSKANGMSTFKYNFSGNINNYNFSWPQTPETNLDFLRGDLIEKIDYSFVNGALKKIEENRYDYFNNYDDLFFNPNSDYNYCIGLHLTTLNNEFMCGGSRMLCSRAAAQFFLGYYKLFSIQKYLSKHIKVRYNLSGEKPITEINEFKYNNPLHCQPTSIIATNSNNQPLETKYFYPQDLEMANEPFVNELIAKNRIQTPLVTQTYNTVKLSEQKTVYDKNTLTSDLLVPLYVYANKGAVAINLNSDKKITYDQYDDKGNILQYTQEGGPPISIIWGYNKTQPIAKIENVTYASIPSGTITSLQTLSDDDDDNCMSDSCKEQQLRNALNALRNTLTQSMVTTYTYNPLIGVTSITDAKGIPSYYEYDPFNRLKFVKDKDLNVVQKYCYNYKGQQTDCGDNSSTSDVQYKSIARNGSFTKNNCASGGVASSVVYNQVAGVSTSTISQVDADAIGLAKFNLDGQANANTNGSCTFKSIARSGSFTKNNCASGGISSSVAYNQVAGVSISRISQADADAIGLTKFNSDGQNNANTNGSCTFKSIARSGSFTKNNCAPGGVGSSVAYNQVAGVSTSTISQADADAIGLAKFNVDGQANANTNGICTFKSIARSSSFTKNNCASGGVASSVVYNQVAGVSTSTISQVDADAIGLAKFNLDGQANANTNGSCTFKSIARSGSFTKNNCASGGTSSSVAYNQVAGVSISRISQADADAIGLTKFNSDGQNNANTNGSCTFKSIARSGSFTKNNCAPGGIGSSVAYNQVAGVSTSRISQADADAIGLAKFNVDGQTNANTNGICTYSSIARNGSFTRNNCEVGGIPSTITFSQAAGAIVSTISQVDADRKGLDKFNANGQVYANTTASCTFKSIARSGPFTKNNCKTGTTGTIVIYNQLEGAVTSTISQADADSNGLVNFIGLGQVYANFNGLCTFYSIAQSSFFVRNNCGTGIGESFIKHSQSVGAVTSTISQEDADSKGWTKFANDGQANANQNSACKYSSIAQSGSFTRNNCGTSAGAPVIYNQRAGAATSTISQEDADAKGLALLNTNGQANANANGSCIFYNTIKSSTLTKNNCTSGGKGSNVTYTVAAGTYMSTSSQADADAMAQSAVNNNGQAYANRTGACTFLSEQIKHQIYKNDYCPPGTTYPYVYYIVPYGKYQSAISQSDANNKAWEEVSAKAQAYANETGACLRAGELEE